LLTDAGIPFTTWLKEEVAEEYPADLSPAEVVAFLSRLKADNYRKELGPRDILITADTIVVLDDKILGKPADRSDALAMLQALSGRSHEVITGISLTSGNKEFTFTTSTKVWFDHLNPVEIEAYVDEYQPYDKAGSYGIQEWIGYIGIHRIEGSYFNVMGLPVQRLYKELQYFTEYLTIRNPIVP